MLRELKFVCIQRSNCSSLGISRWVSCASKCNQSDRSAPSSSTRCASCGCVYTYEMYTYVRVSLKSRFGPTGAHIIRKLTRCQAPLPDCGKLEADCLQCRDHRLRNCACGLRCLPRLGRNSESGREAWWALRRCKKVVGSEAEPDPWTPGWDLGVIETVSEAQATKPSFQGSVCCERYSPAAS